MKRFLPVLIAVLIVGGGAGVYSAYKEDHKSKPNNQIQTAKQQTAQPAKTFSPKKACDVITIDDVKKVLGQDAQINTSSPKPEETPDLILSNCVYTRKGANPAENVSASLVVRSAKTETGAKSNESGFNNTRPVDAQDVAGLGDKAYWNPQMGQLNILAHDNWYIVSTGPLKVTDRKLEQVRQLTDALNAKL
jgi:hypothetical protein